MLEAWCRACRAGERPTDGYYVTLWRVLFRYPEILAWETMWNDSVHETYEAIYKLVKSIKPQMQVGWHVWHAHSFSPFFRAQTDVKELARYSDYLKMTVYHNLGGTRMETYITSTRNTILRRYADRRGAGVRVPHHELPRARLSRNCRTPGCRRITSIARRSGVWTAPKGPRCRSGRGSTWTSPIWIVNFSRCTPPVIKEVTQGGVSGRRAGTGDLAEILGDEAGESGRRGRRVARNEDPGVKRYCRLRSGSGTRVRSKGRTCSFHVRWTVSGM